MEKLHVGMIKEAGFGLRVARSFLMHIPKKPYPLLPSPLLTRLISYIKHANFSSENIKRHKGWV